MALPVRPTGNGAPKPPLPSTPSAEALPDLSSMGLPEIPQVKRPRSEPTPTQRSVPKAPAEPKAAPAPQDEILDDGWVIDVETGKRFKQLKGYKRGVMKHSTAVIKAGGLTLDQLRTAVDEEPDFDLDNLNGAANTFLSHLRVPLDKEEQKRLREERAKRQRAYDEAASRVEEEDEFED
jgi:hypothetical protein